MGIEPTSEAWEASILPLYDARSVLQLSDYTQRCNCSYRPAIFHVFQFPAGKRACRMATGVTVCERKQNTREDEERC